MFLFFLWGVRRRPKVIAVTREIDCGNCNNAVNFVLIQEKRWFTMNWIPIIPLKRLYSLKCLLCSATKELTKDEFKKVTIGDEK